MSGSLSVDLKEILLEQGINDPEGRLAAVAAAALDRADTSWLALFDPTGRLTEAQRQALGDALAQRRPKPPGSGAKADFAVRLAALRQDIAAQGLDGFLIPRADEYLNEYVAPCAERLAWLTGFTGSAGLAAVLTDQAAIFVDGRYTLQVTAEVDTDAYSPLHITETPPQNWLVKQLLPGQRVGVDPWLHNAEQLERFADRLEDAGVTLVELDSNPIDRVWLDRPPAPLGPVSVWALEHAGRTAADKIADLSADLAQRNLAAVVLSQPDSIAWLLNIRGADVPHTPLPLSFAILAADGTVQLFIAADKLLPGLREHLGPAVRLRPPSEFTTALGEWAGERVLLDAGQAPAAILRTLTAGGALVQRGQDPCLLPRACKNDVELAGMRAAHRRDAVAMVRFLAWIDDAVAAGGQTETSVSDHLEQLRRAGAGFRDLSFPTISGAGANGAIVHYRADPLRAAPLATDMLYLVDSGAQYPDGTTDITRTIVLGRPTAEQRDRFTRVLKGHIALSRAIFPAGTTGSQLDVLARLALWQAGIDYDHGTGHGVGCFLSVHEGPQRISKAGNTIALRPGMVLSNEPGYYKSGAFGIRIENLLAVVPVAIDGAERDMLGFEPLTLVPIDRRLIAVALLTQEERAWVDAYHDRVRQALIDLVDDDVAPWLLSATAALRD